ncbi:MAG: division plane positioning ATPase MipZ [Pseudomonadota bacterium]
MPTLVFAQQKGGAGKTTLLVQAAVALRAMGRAVTLVDLDPQRSLSRWAGLRGDPDLPCEAASDWGAGAALRRAARAADVVLADCPGSADVLLRAAVREADLVVIPCQPSPVDAWAAASTLAMCAREKARHAVVLNRLPPRGGAEAETRAALAAEGAEILPEGLGNRVAFSTAFLQGRSPLDLAPRSKAAAEARAMAEALIALA